MSTLTKIRLQDGTLGELNAITALDQACFGLHSWSLEQVRAEFSKLGQICRVLLDGETDLLRAAAMGWVIEDEAELLRISVHPDQRRNGLGRRLLEDFLSQAFSRGARRCFLEVRIDNQAAIGLYTELAFQSTGVRRAYYSDGCDAQLMETRRLQ